MTANRPLCPKCESGKVNLRVDMSLKCHRCGYESRGYGMVVKEKWFFIYKEPPKHPRGYYQLKGEYLFRNFITGRYNNMWGKSDPTTSKERWEMLPTLREHAIDRAKNWLAVVLHHSHNKEEFKLQWILVAILDEEWIKY